MSNAAVSSHSQADEIPVIKQQPQHPDLPTSYRPGLDKSWQKWEQTSGEQKTGKALGAEARDANCREPTSLQRTQEVDFNGKDKEGIGSAGLKRTRRTNLVTKKSEKREDSKEQTTPDTESVEQVDDDDGNCSDNGDDGGDGHSLQKGNTSSAADNKEADGTWSAKQYYTGRIIRRSYLPACSFDRTLRLGRPNVRWSPHHVSSPGCTLLQHAETHGGGKNACRCVCPPLQLTTLPCSLLIGGLNTSIVEPWFSCSELDVSLDPDIVYTDTVSCVDMGQAKRLSKAKAKHSMINPSKDMSLGGSTKRASCLLTRKVGSVKARMNSEHQEIGGSSAAKEESPPLGRSLADSGSQKSAAITCENSLASSGTKFEWQMSAGFTAHPTLLITEFNKDSATSLVTGSSGQTKASRKVKHRHDWKQTCRAGLGAFQNQSQSFSSHRDNYQGLSSAASHCASCQETNSMAKNRSNYQEPRSAENQRHSSQESHSQMPCSGAGQGQNSQGAISQGPSSQAISSSAIQTLSNQETSNGTRECSNSQDPSSCSSQSPNNQAHNSQTTTSQGCDSGAGHGTTSRRNKQGSRMLASTPKATIISGSHESAARAARGKSKPAAGRIEQRNRKGMPAERGSATTITSQARSFSKVSNCVQVYQPNVITVTTSGQSLLSGKSTPVLPSERNTQNRATRVRQTNQERVWKIVSEKLPGEVRSKFLLCQVSPLIEKVDRQVHQQDGEGRRVFMSGDNGTVYPSLSYGLIRSSTTHQESSQQDISQEISKRQHEYEAHYIGKSNITQIAADWKVQQSLTERNVQQTTSNVKIPQISANRKFQQTVAGVGLLKIANTKSPQTPTDKVSHTGDMKFRRTTEMNIGQTAADTKKSQLPPKRKITQTPADKKFTQTITDSNVPQTPTDKKTSQIFEGIKSLQTQTELNIEQSPADTKSQSTHEELTTLKTVAGTNTQKNPTDKKIPKSATNKKNSNEVTDKKKKPSSATKRTKRSSAKSLSAVFNDMREKGCLVSNCPRCIEEDRRGAKSKVTSGERGQALQASTGPHRGPRKSARSTYAPCRRRSGRPFVARATCRILSAQERPRAPLKQSQCSPRSPQTPVPSVLASPKKLLSTRCRVKPPSANSTKNSPARSSESFRCIPSFETDRKKIENNIKMTLVQAKTEAARCGGHDGHVPGSDHEGLWADKSCRITGCATLGEGLPASPALPLMTVKQRKLARPSLSKGCGITVVQSPLYKRPTASKPERTTSNLTFFSVNDKNVNSNASVFSENTATACLKSSWWKLIVDRIQTDFGHIRAHTIDAVTFHHHIKRRLQPKLSSPRQSRSDRREWPSVAPTPVAKLGLCEKKKRGELAGITPVRNCTTEAHGCRKCRRYT